MSSVQRIILTEFCLDQPIIAEAILYPEGLHISVYGGELPHIGAISIVDPDGEVKTIPFNGHKDAFITHKWIGALTHTGIRPIVIEAGIHYDALSYEGIGLVLKATDHLLEKTLECIDDLANQGAGEK